MSTPAETRWREATRPRPRRHRWTVRLEYEPWHDEEGGFVPAPAVWTVRNARGRVVFVTSEPRLARLVADARAHGRPDPIDEE